MSTTYRAGLIVLGLISVGDLLAPLLTDGQTPPMVIALIAAGLGALSIGLAVLAWPGRLAAAFGLIALRLLSALTAVPGLGFDGVPPVARLLAGVAVGVTVLGVVLVVAGLRRPAPAVAR